MGVTLYWLVPSLTICILQITYRWYNSDRAPPLYNPRFETCCENKTWDFNSEIYVPERSCTPEGGDPTGSRCSGPHPDATNDNCCGTTQLRNQVNILVRRNSTQSDGDSVPKATWVLESGREGLENRKVKVKAPPLVGMTWSSLVLATLTVLNANVSVNSNIEWMTSFFF